MHQYNCTQIINIIFLEHDFTCISLRRKQGSKDTTLQGPTRDPPARSRGKAQLRTGDATRARDPRQRN